MKLAAGPEPVRPASVDEVARRDMTLVSLAAVTWGFRLVGRTRMLSEAWAALDQDTVFVQVPSYRTAFERLTSSFGRREQLPVVRPWPAYPSNLWPHLGESGLRRAVRKQARELRRQLERQMSWDEGVALVVSPVWTPWLDELPFRHVVYDCIDELAVHIRRPELATMYRHWEEELLDRASGAVVTAEQLGAALHARRSNLPIALIRNGVDVERFQQLAASQARPEDVPRTGRPTVGFVGALYEWIDWEMIADVAAQNADIDFVFVGPHDGRGDIERIAYLPNTHLLGPCAYDRVPAYVNAFDVCWVPFKQDEIGLAANPVKIYEYLALGKPVVTTPVADTDRFGGVVTVARDAHEMAAGLHGALHERNGATDRIAFARANTWRERAGDYIRFVASIRESTPNTP